MVMMQSQRVADFLFVVAFSCSSLASERACGLAIPLLHPASTLLAQPQNRVSQYQLLIGRSVEITQQTSDCTKVPPSAESGALALILPIRPSAGPCECTPARSLDPADPSECTCARHITPPSFAANDGVDLSLFLTLGSDAAAYPAQSAANRPRVESFFSAPLTIPTVLPVPLLCSSAIFLSPRLWWSCSVGGELHLLMSRVTAACRRPIITRRAEWTQEFEGHHRGMPPHQRTPYRSPLVVAVDSLCSYVSQVRSAISDSVTTAGSTPGGLIFAQQLYRFSVSAIMQVGIVIMRYLEALAIRIGSGAARDLLPGLMAHTEANLLAEAIRQANNGSNGINATQMKGIMMTIQGHVARIAASVRSSAQLFGSQSWPELMEPNSLVRRHMPRPMSDIRVSSVPSTSTLTPSGLSPSSAGGSISPSPTPILSPTMTQPSPALPIQKDDRPTPLLSVIEEYLLSVLPFAAACCPIRSSGSLLSSVLNGLLTSFLDYLRSRSGGQINPQGAARLNQEIRFAYQWFEMRHILPIDDGGVGVEVGAVPTAVDANAYPGPASMWHTAAGLNGLLTDESIQVWRSFFMRVGVWSRLSAIVQVLLHPSSYGPPPATAAAAGHKRRPSKFVPPHAPSAEPIVTWTWENGTNNEDKLNAHMPESHQTTSANQPTATNKIAPAPPNLTSPLSPPLPSTYPPSNVVHGSSLTDLSAWLALSSNAHASKFVAAGAGRATVVDWPTIATQTN